MDSRGNSEERKVHSHHSEKSTEATVPWIQSPMKAWNEKSQSFSPRHEASTIELFFDLFFVANLATFTQYHAIYNRDHFWSYIAFFAILWTTWFHIVCFDARFASDSVWERACKIVHFCTFAGFALVGYKFNLLDDKTPHWIYRLLCWALFISRFWLALQYLITTILCSRRKHRHLRLTVPLALGTVLFFITAAVYGGLFNGFNNAKKNLAGVIAALYTLIVVELIGILGISCIWKKLSFKATHIAERLGLLGLIIIGEGVIGTTKTITRIMGRNGVYFEGCALVFCLILIMVFMWILYFDNLPNYRFGPTKQQFWMAMHLPLHLAILGVVEGSQQLALARYIYYSAEKLIVKAWYGCVGMHLDGSALAQNLTDAVKYFKISDSAQGNLSLGPVFDEIYFLGNQSGVCSPGNTSNLQNGLGGMPLSSREFLTRAIGAMFQAFNLDIPIEGDVYGLRVATRSWRVVYIYYWSAILLLLACLTASALLAQRNFHYGVMNRLPSLIARAIMVIFSIVILVLGVKNPYFRDEYLGSAWILPTVVLQLWIVCLGDRASKLLKRRREKKMKRYEEVTPAESSDEERAFMSTERNAYGYPGH